MESNSNGLNSLSGVPPLQSEGCFRLKLVEWQLRRDHWLGLDSLYMAPVWSFVPNAANARFPPIMQNLRRNRKPSSSWALAMEAFEGRDVLKAAAWESIFEVKKETVLLGSVEPEISSIT